MRHQYAGPPAWLWRLSVWLLGALLLGLAALAAALALGLADPPRAGPRLWLDDFQGGLERWQISASPGAALGPQDGHLTAGFSAADQWVIAVTEAPGPAFTLEVAASQISGEPGAAYGLVFAWHGPEDYAAVLVNGNGYAEAYRLRAGERQSDFPWQQWPHLLAAPEFNRVRLDAQPRQLVARINDEWLAALGGPTEGKIGLMARSQGPGRVVFSWVQLWAP